MCMKRIFYYMSVMVLLVGQPAIAADEEEYNLEKFLSETRLQNLSLKVEAAASLATSEAAAGYTLPAPMLGITQIQDQSGRTNGFEINQTIPFPTKLSSEHNSRKLEARTKGAMLNSRERELLAEAKLLYFNIWRAQERIRLLQEKKSAIQQHLKLARATSRSDSFLKIHLIKVESDLDLLENEIIQAEQERREKQILAAEFLNRNPKEFRPIAKALAVSTIPLAKSMQNTTQIEVKKLELETLKSREQEAQASWIPDFNLRYRMMSSTQSEIMLGATLPFAFFWQPRSVAGKASAERLKGEILLEKENQQIASRLETLSARSVSLKKQLDQFADRLLPSAENRMRRIHNLAPRDLETLQDHRDAMEALPELKLKALEVRRQYEETISELEKFTSGDVK